MKRESNKRTIEDLASMFGLITWEKLDELNMDWFGEGLDWSEEHEEESAEIESKRRDDFYNQWHDAVEFVATKLLEEHGLKLEPVKFRRKVPAGTRPWEYRIVPATSWTAAADLIRETVNGCGPFYYSSLKEMLDSGPYTARQAVLSHLGWVKEYPAVYGHSSAEQMYERRMRY